MHRSRMTIAGTALATMALTMTSIGVAAQDQTAGVPASPSGYAELDQALAGEFAGRVVTLQTQWNSAELDNFEAAVAPFEEATGIDIDIQSIGRNHELLLRTAVLAGTPPDISQIAQPSVMQAYANEGALVDATEWLGTDRFMEDYASFMSMAAVGDSIFAVPYKVDVKSFVWYPKQKFEEAGYQVPTTWDELISLSEQIVADGGVPWCISMEHGAATGWVGTDWIEGVLLRTAPPETYEAWWKGELKFDSPEVRKAFEIVGDIWFREGFAYGGPTYINSTWVGQTMDPMFEDPPGCWMHKQALWYGPGFFPDVRAAAGDADYVTPNTLGEVIDVFYFPPIDPEFGNPVVGAGDVFMVFNDREEVRAVAQFLATPEAGQAWIENAGIVIANAGTPAEWYAGKYGSEKASEILANATTFGFDGGDLMPPEVGTGSFWEGMVSWVTAEGANLDEVLASIDAEWPSE